MAKRHRSPSYPALTLTEALERARTFYAKEGKHSAPIRVAVSHWGYSPKSSGGTATIAALKAWGFMLDEGAGEQRTVRLSEEALKILRDERTESAERDALMSGAAERPKVIKNLLAQYPGGDVSDENLRHYLIMQEYNPNSVNDIVKVFHDAKAYLAPEKDVDEASFEAADVAEVDSASISADSASHRHVNQSTGNNVLPALRENMRQETFMLSDSEVLIQLPSSMTADDYQDFLDWLELLKRRVGRSVKPSEGTGGEN
jgi:hypothetical protein